MLNALENAARQGTIPFAEARPGGWTLDFSIAPDRDGTYFPIMPMTLDQIVEAASHLPREQVAEVVDRLTSALHTGMDPEIEESWKQETRRRLAELESGSVQAVPGDVVSHNIRGIVGR
jgi:putative addiction module component (TIGR02574 family)